MVDSGCWKSGLCEELSGYGWNVKPSITGTVRPLARYAAPSAWMNAVGDEVGRVPSGRSEPRGASAPPQMRSDGSTAFTAS